MQENASTNIFTLYSEVRPSPVKWLWYPYIAAGKITLLQGDPGDGKSTMMIHLISELSRGGVTPDGHSFDGPKRVIYQCSEDGIADTIRPRLNQCGADCEQIAFINEEVYTGLTLDDERLREAIIAFRPQLVVIDPIQAYLGSDSDLQMAGRARRLMHRLGLWASTYECAIVLIGHLNKREGSKDLYRSLGSIDVIAAARSVLQVGHDEFDSDIRIIHQIKNSLAPVGTDIRFEIRPQSGFRWLERHVRETKLTSELPVNDVPSTKMEKAAMLIRHFLADGDMKSVDIYQRLQEAGIGHKTAESTKKEIGVKCYRKMKQWYWSLGRIDE